MRSLVRVSSWGALWRVLVADSEPVLSMTPHCCKFCVVCCIASRIPCSSAANITYPAVTLTSTEFLGLIRSSLKMVCGKKYIRSRTRCDPKILLPMTYFYGICSHSSSQVIRTCTSWIWLVIRYILTRRYSYFSRSTRYSHPDCREKRRHDGTLSINVVTIQEISSEYFSVNRKIFSIL